MSYELQAFGNIWSGVSDFMHGQQARAAGKFTADQLRQNAGQARASSQRQAYNVEEQSKMVMSRALAVAASSGGGASDPGVINIMAKIASEGAYRKAVALYEGEDAARRMGMQADAAEYEGQSIQANDRMHGFLQFANAGVTMMGGKARQDSLRSKYGAMGPTFNQDEPKQDWY